MEGRRGLSDTKLHGSELTGVPGQTLLGVNNIEITQRFKLHPYPYFCLDPESSSRSRRDLYKVGV